MTSKRKWTSGELIRVSNAIRDDQEYESNNGIRCPVCDNRTLSYEQFTFLDAVAWCTTCETGYQQGRGLELSKAR